MIEIEPPTPDDVVLVPSAAGGLGWLLAQAAPRRRGARWWSPRRGGRSERRSWPSSAPDLVVDYGAEGWDERVRAAYDGVTLVYDGVGGAVGRTSLELLRPGGRLVMFGYSSGTTTQLDSATWSVAAITAGWSLGPRMVALPGGIPGLAVARARTGGGRAVAAAGLDVSPR